MFKNHTLAFVKLSLLFSSLFYCLFFFGLSSWPDQAQAVDLTVSGGSSVTGSSIFVPVGKPGVPMLKFNIAQNLASGDADVIINSMTIKTTGIQFDSTAGITAAYVYSGAYPTGTLVGSAPSGSSSGTLPVPISGVSLAYGDPAQGFYVLYDFSNNNSMIGVAVSAQLDSMSISGGTGGGYTGTPAPASATTTQKTVEGIDVSGVSVTGGATTRGSLVKMLEIDLTSGGESMSGLTFTVGNSSGTFNTSNLDSVNLYDTDPATIPTPTPITEVTSFSSSSSVDLEVPGTIAAGSHVYYVGYKIKSTAPSGPLTFRAKVAAVAATGVTSSNTFNVPTINIPTNEATATLGSSLSSFSFVHDSFATVGIDSTVTITARDSSGTTITSYTGTVTVASSSTVTWKDSTGSTVLGTGSISAAFSGGTLTLKLNDSEAEGITVTVTDSSLTPAVHDSFSMTISNPVANFLLEASSTAPPLGGETAIVITARDSSNVPISTYSQSITNFLSAVKTDGTPITAPTSFHFRGTGITDNNNASATIAGTAWSGGSVTIYVSYTVAAEGVIIKATDGATTPMIGSSPTITWQGGPAGATIILTPDPPTIPPDGATVSTVTSDVMYDSSGFPIPDHTQFTVATTLGTITDADVNPAISGIQIESAAGIITIHLQAPTTTTGSAVFTAEAVSGSPKGNTRVFICNLKVVSVSSSASIVTRLDTGIPLQITIQNIGSTTTLADLKPAFYSGLVSGTNVTGEYSAIPDFSTPVSISSGETRTFNFTVAAPNLRTNGEIILDAMMEVTGDPYIYKRWKEQDVANWHAIAETTDSWTATGGITYVVDVPSYISHMTTTNSSGTVNFNNGDAILPNSGLNIYFFDGGYNIDLASGPLAITRGGTTLTSGSDYQYYSSEGRLTIRDMGATSGILVLANIKDLSGMVLNASGGDQIAYVISAGLFVGQFLCYPNPATAGSSVKFGWEQTKDATVRIYLHNSTGELLWQKEVSALSGYNEVTWEGSDNFGRVLGGGLYALRLLAIDSEGNTYLTRTKLGIF